MSAAAPLTHSAASGSIIEATAAVEDLLDKIKNKKNNETKEVAK
jgi:hypothetical protein